MASGGRDHQVKIWDVRRSPQQPSIYYGVGRIGRHGLASDRSGSTLAVATWGHNGSQLPIRLFNTRNWQWIETACRRADGFRTLDISPDGRFLLADWGSDICLWDVAADRPVRYFAGHGAAVACVAYSPDARRFASGSEDGTARIWNCGSNDQPFVLDGHTAAVTSVAFDARDRWVVTGGLDGRTLVWNTDTGTLHRELGERAGAINRVLCHPREPVVAAASQDGSIRLWQIDSGRCVATLTCRTGGVHDLSFSPDGKRLVSSGEDGNIRFWDWARQEELVCLNGTAGGLDAIQFDRQGAWFVAGSNNSPVMDVWNMQAWEPLSLAQRQVSWHAAEAEGLLRLGRYEAAGEHLEMLRHMRQTTRSRGDLPGPSSKASNVGRQPAMRSRTPSSCWSSRGPLTA